jgi:tetratricopeptide (TPR) repeat protein
MDPTRSTTRDLAVRAIEQGLLGPEAFQDVPEPPPGYELVRCLGRGGCGAVWLARDARLDRPVAIKFLNDARAADVERFRREARFTARLNNPSIVQVYEMGEARGQPYIVMQFVEGGNLAGARLGHAEVARVLRDVALALRHAHAEGIVHRDIKPENILLDREGRPFLTDFGIARSLRGGAADTISSDGQIMGTPGLMPPEQARGEIQAVDARSDVYALGATLYLTLTGRYPFEGASVVDVLHAVIHEPPPLMRARDASIPRSLETIAARCMQKRREDRYQHVGEVIAELDRFLDRGDEGAVPSAWIRRLVAQQETAPRPPAEDPASDAWWTVGMDVVRELAAWDAELYRVSGSLARAFAQLDGIRGRLEAILAARPDTAWARFYRGVALFRRGRLHEALEEMERAIDRMRNLAGASFELGRVYLALHLRDQRLARKHLSKVGVDEGLRSTRGRLEQAALAFREAARLGGDVPAWLDGCTDAVARLAESDYAGCIAICDRILAEEPDIEGLWKLRGDAQHLCGGDPFGSYDRALQVRRTYFDALHARAEAHLARGQVAEARHALDRALRIHSQYPDAFALLARSWVGEARASGDPVTIERAARLAGEALALDPRHYDASVTLAELRALQARATGRREHLDEALGILRAARDLDGCPNRVNLLAARTRIERARHDAARGGDPRPDLDAVLAACAHEAATVSDNQPWEAIRREALGELERAGVPIRPSG